jgi:hypothetical protein
MTSQNRRNNDIFESNPAVDHRIGSSVKEEKKQEQDSAQA